MLSVSRPVDRTPLPPGFRHGIATPVINGLRLFCDSSRLESRTPNRAEAYPSPPMSGSPPLPSRAPYEGHASGATTAFNPRYEGAHPRWPSDQFHGEQETIRDRSQGLLPLSRSYPQETPSRSAHIRRLSENLLPSVPRYISQDSRGSFPPPHQHSPASSAAYRTPTPARGPSQDANAQFPRVTSPKAQRKPKGHVASACLPCKRAHLRCDAQRPCSRCVSNGKETSCKDIQHKKRGRPRLRDEREPRSDSGRYSLPHDLSNRQPPNIHPSTSGQQFMNEPARHSSLHLHPYAAGDSNAGPRYLERVLSSERSAAIPGPLPGSTQDEPVAYLNMRMEFVKVSNTFDKAVGSIPGLVGRKLFSVILPKERDRALAMEETLAADQKRLEPNYLPPIFDKGDQVAELLGVSASEIADRHLDRRECLTFVAADGNLRPYSIRLGIFKEAAFYFVMLFLESPAPGSYQSPGSHFQNAILHTAQRPSHQASFSQPLPLPPPATVPPSFDGDRRNFSDGPSSSSRPTPRSPRNSSHQPTYSPSSQGGDYTRPSPLQIPRSEMSAAPRPHNTEPSYTLPPIRTLPEQGTGVEASTHWQRDDRQRRVTIGGLIDRPEGMLERLH